MLRKSYSIILAAAFLAVFMIAGIHSVGSQDMPFGSTGDVEFANKTWTALKDYRSWKLKSDYYDGQAPHGSVVRTYYGNVAVDGKSYHVILKENYGGEEITIEKVAKEPDKFLGAVTVMVQREEGYDKDNNNWFWIKFNPKGKVMTNPKGMSLAGRVAKGMDKGCISCHGDAKGNDYLYINDKK